MADMKESYTLMFTDYPDIVNLTQMRKMLGGISNSLAYRMLREKKIKNTSRKTYHRVDFPFLK